ncbi:MAG: STAS domain-containing protein [Candidatus Margulisiibacteriota bacterium]|jgi:anti-anti-sigma factor
MDLNLKIDVKHKKDIVIISPKGELDDYNAPKLNDLFMKLINEDNKRKFVVNLEETSYVDSVGLGTIVLASKKLASLDGMLSLVCAKPQIIKLLDSSGVMSMIKRNISLFNTLNEALDSMSK